MTPLRKYNLHRCAALRTVGFELTFEEWWDIWQKSGHWEERGKCKGQYVMSRVGDLGPYKVGNVFIQLASQNVVDGTTRPDSLLRRKLNTKPHNEKTKQKMSIANKDSWIDPIKRQERLDKFRATIAALPDEVKAARKVARIEISKRPKSEQARINMSAVQRARGPNSEQARANQKAAQYGRGAKHKEIS